MSKRYVGLAAALVVTLLAAGAAADPAPEPPIHLKSPSEVRTARGSELRLPPGYFLPEPTWAKLDNEIRRLQEAETRLKAENESLRAVPSTSWGSWTLAAGALAGGILIGLRL